MKYKFRKGFVIAIIILVLATPIIPAMAKLNSKNNSPNKTKQAVLYNDVLEDSSYKLAGLSYTPDSDYYYENQFDILESKDLLSNQDIYFTDPLNNDILRAGDIIIINGTITGEKFKYYKIEYGEGRNPLKWHTTGISLTDNGESPVENDIVATWDTSHIVEPGFFTLKITTHLKRPFNAQISGYFKSVFRNHHPINTLFDFKGSNSTISFLDKKVKTKIKNIYLDPTLKEGWPQKIKWDKADLWVWAGLVEPVVSDINNDGDMEIVVYLGGKPTKIYAFNHDASLDDGWPALVDNEVLPGGNIGSPTIADLDNDGYKEILVNGLNYVYIFNYNGSFLRKIELKQSSQPAMSMECIVYDLDNDGNKEILKKYLAHDSEGYRLGISLTVFDIYGNVLPGWPQLHNDYKGPDGNLYPAGIEGIPAIGNLDDDSDLEIVVCANRNVFDDPSDPGGTWRVEGRIVVYNLNGSILNGFPLDISHRFGGHAPAVGDINNDGQDEIIFSAGKGIYVIDRYGNNLSGWPQMLNRSIQSSPALADFNNDGFLEIVISTEAGPFTYIFDYQGNIVTGWPQQTGWAEFRTPIVGDVNGDGNPDIITTAGNGVMLESSGNGGVYAWNFDGSLIDGFPKVTESDAHAGATISDIDNDGNVEIIASSDWNMDFETYEQKHRSTIYVWDLDSNYNGETMKWPMFHRDTMHTGHYTPSSIVPYNWIISTKGEK